MNAVHVYPGAFERIILDVGYDNPGICTRMWHFTFLTYSHAYYIQPAGLGYCTRVGDEIAIIITAPPTVTEMTQNHNSYDACLENLQCDS